MPLHNTSTKRVAFEPSISQTDKVKQYEAAVRLLRSAGFTDAVFGRYYLIEQSDKVGYISLEEESLG